MKNKTSISHDEALIHELRENREFAVEYLRAALEEDDEPRVLLMALRRVVQARGIARIAKAAGIERYRMMPAVGDSPAFIGALKELVLRAVEIHP